MILAIELIFSLLYQIEHVPVGHVPVGQVAVGHVPVGQDDPLVEPSDVLNVENCFTGLRAPHFGHFFAVSDRVRAKWSKI